MKKRKVLITGILGQDGANMAEYLLRDPSCEVYGMMRRSANPNFENTVNFKNNENFKFIFGDLTDTINIENIVKQIQPDYLINFAANSFVGVSWDMPLHVMDVNTNGVLRCLEAIKKFQPNCRFYSAGSSEQFGDVDYSPQDIKHPMKPRSPYGASKCAAHHLVKVYRESYGIYAVHGILFNHEGTKRGEEFVTRKITKGVARIYNEMFNLERWRSRGVHHCGKYEPIELGNVYSKRDWSDSEDFVDGIWLMLNQKEPKDYVLASGETHSIKEFVTQAFAAADIRGQWIEVEGKPERAKFIHSCVDNYYDLVVINPEFYRPAEVDLLLGDSTPIREELGWEPKTSFKDLVNKMVAHDLKAYK